MADATDSGSAVVACVLAHLALAMLGAFAARRAPEAAIVLLGVGVVVVCVLAAATGLLSADDR